MTTHVNAPVTRVLSPTRREKPPSQLLVLENDKAVLEGKSNSHYNDRLNPTGVSTTKACNNSKEDDFVILRSDYGIKQSEKQTASVRKEHYLPTVKRKEEQLPSGSQYSEVLNNAKLKDTNALTYKLHNCNLGTTTPTTIAKKQNTGHSKTNPPKDPISDDVEKAKKPIVPDSTSVDATCGSNVPLELISSFLDALMDKNYSSARQFCDQILNIDPENSLCKEFRETIGDMINLRNQNEEEDDIDDTDSFENNTSQAERVDNQGSARDTSESEDDDDDDEESGEEDTDEEDSDEDVGDVLHLNLLMGGISVRKKP